MFSSCLILALWLEYSYSSISQWTRSCCNSGSGQGSWHSFGWWYEIHCSNLVTGNFSFNNQFLIRCSQFDVFKFNDIANIGLSNSSLFTTSIAQNSFCFRCRKYFDLRFLLSIAAKFMHLSSHLLQLWRKRPNFIGSWISTKKAFDDV